MAVAQRRIRIGIDTGGTFTDVVAVDEDSGELVTTKTPSTPGNPADGFIAGIEKVLGLLGADGERDRARSATARRWPPTSCSRARSSALGFVTTEGYEFDARDRPAVGARRLRQLLLLGEARPDRAGRPGPTVGGRLDVTGAEVRPFDEEAAVAAARWFRDQGHHHASASASCTPTPTTTTSCAMREVLRREHPEAVVSISQRGAARVPRVRARDDHARRRRGQAATSAATSTNITRPARRLHRATRHRCRST